MRGVGSQGRKGVILGQVVPPPAPRDLPLAYQGRLLHPEGRPAVCEVARFLEGG